MTISMVWWQWRGERLNPAFNHGRLRAGLDASANGQAP
jgi:hypothetical protein